MVRKLVRALPALLLLAASIPARAQEPAVVTGTVRVQEPAVITGTVRDSTGRPVSSARVRLRGTTTGTLTGADGRYTLTVRAALIRPDQPVWLESEAIGFLIAAHPVQLASGGRFTQDFILPLLLSFYQWR